MQHLLQFGLSNAVAAAVLAVLAAVATRVWRNPHFAYALWFVVLLRLAAPPLLPVGVPLPAWMAAVSRDVDPPSRGVDPRGIPVGSTHRPAEDNLSYMVTQPEGRADVPTFSKVGARLRSDDVRNRLGGNKSNVPPTEFVSGNFASQDRGDKPRGSLVGGESRASRRASIARLLAVSWLTGTLCYLLLTAFRVGRFARVLRRARRVVPAALAAEAAEVAAAVGLRRVPRLAFVDAALPPMVWPGWRPVVLLPETLCASLGAGERRLLLSHEFLHLRRRDHLVRWFEVGVAGLYWWNPIAWWAVARLQRAEEDCCDAGVLAAHPHDSARYGETLVSVAQFLSAGTSPAPSLSLGVARNHHIKRRLTMILHGPRWPELSRGRLAAFSLLGAALVAVTWTAAKGQSVPAAPVASNALVAVVERPIIRCVVYQGAKQIALSRLAEETGLKVGKPYDMQVNKEATQRLQDFYHEHGYFEATVELTKGNKPEDRDVVFRIQEGVKEKVAWRVPDKREAGLSLIEVMQPAPGDDELRKLQKERYNAALRELKLYEYQYEAGTTRISAVCLSTKNFFDAWKALAQRPADELRALDWYVGYTNRLWNGAHARLAAGGVTGFNPVDEAEARAAHFEAEIEAMKRRQALTAKSSEQKVRRTTPSDRDLRVLLELEVAAGTSPGTAPTTEPRSPGAAVERKVSGLPRMLVAESVALGAGDDQRVKLLKEHYNAALRSLRAVNIGREHDPSVTVADVVTSARQLLAAKVALVGPQELVGVYEDYLDLMKYFEIAVTPASVGDGGISRQPAYAFEAIREARLEAELKWDEARRAASNDRGDKQPAPGIGDFTPAQPGAVEGTAKSGPPLSKGPLDRLPALLTRQPFDPQAQDDERLRLLKERYNAALRLLQASHQRHAVDPETTATNVLAAARRVLAADLALMSDPKIGKQEGQSPIDARQRYFELMKFLERDAEARFEQHIGGRDELEAAHEARLDAELELLEAKPLKDKPLSKDKG